MEATVQSESSAPNKPPHSSKNKIIILVVALLLLVLAFIISITSSDEYKEVRDALDGQFYLYNGGSDTDLSGITFHGSTASIETCMLTTGEYSDPVVVRYEIDDTSITILQADAEDLVIHYTLKDNQITLEKGYYTLEELQNELQGCWETPIPTITAPDKFQFKMDETSITSRWVYPNAGEIRGDVYIYEYGPEEYEILFGGFDCSAANGYSFNIIDNEPTILHDSTVCYRIEEFPSKDGYQDLIDALVAYEEKEAEEKANKEKQNAEKEVNNNWHKNYDGNGYYNDDGYIVYNNNGVTEITDGYGNWAQDTDGDGELDTFGSDNY